MMFGPRTQSSPISPGPSASPERVANLDLDAGDGDAHRGQPRPLRLVALEPEPVVLGRQVRDRGCGLGHAVELGDLAVEAARARGAAAPARSARRRTGRCAGCSDRPSRTPARRGASRASSARATVWEMRSRSIAARTASASKRGSTTWPAPTQVHAKRLAVPAAWNIGQTCRKRSPCAVAGREQVVAGVGEQVAVAQHHALGEARRPAGVADRRERVGLDALRRAGCARHELLVREAVAGDRRRSIEHELAQRRDSAPAAPWPTSSWSASTTSSSTAASSTMNASSSSARRKFRSTSTRPKAGTREPALEVRERVGAEEADSRAGGDLELGERRAEAADASRQLARTSASGLPPSRRRRRRGRRAARRSGQLRSPSLLTWRENVTSGSLIRNHQGA